MRYFVIENEMTEQKFLLSLDEWGKNGIPKGFRKRTQVALNLEDCKNYPIYK
ncbi:MAG: hypothetical protein AB2421_18335 [Thermotaleaceae bacterium]